MVAVLVSRFQLHLADRMGGLAGCESRQVMRGLMSVQGGLYLRFEPR